MATVGHRLAVDPGPDLAERLHADRRGARRGEETEPLRRPVARVHVERDHAGVVVPAHRERLARLRRGNALPAHYEK